MFPDFADVDAALFAEGQGDDEDDDDFARLLVAAAEPSAQPEPVRQSLELSKYDIAEAGAKKRKLEAKAAVSSASKTARQSTTLDAMWKAPRAETATPPPVSASVPPTETNDDIDALFEEPAAYSPPPRYPNLAWNRLSKAKIDEAFPIMFDLKAFLDWQVIDKDQSAVCCACLDFLMPDEDADADEIPPQFRKQLAEASSTSAQNVALLSSCYHVYHETCINQWMERENRCCQCKNRFGRIALYSPVGARLDVRIVHTRIQSLTIREAPNENQAVCFSCHAVGDSDSMMTCASCETTGHWYCCNLEAMPTTPWHCPDHCPQAVHQRRAAHRDLILTATRSVAPARRRRLPASLSNTRRGRGYEAGIRALRDTVEAITQPEAPIYERDLVRDAFDVPFDPFATTYADFHNPREERRRPEVPTSRSDITDLLMGTVPVSELLGASSSVGSSHSAPVAEPAQAGLNTSFIAAGTAQEQHRLDVLTSDAEVIREIEAKLRHCQLKEVEHQKRLTYYSSQTSESATAKYVEHAAKRDEYHKRVEYYRQKLAKARKPSGGSTRPKARPAPKPAEPRAEAPASTSSKALADALAGLQKFAAKKSSANSRGRGITEHESLGTGAFYDRQQT